jgi:DNA polymerase/3'-5' exonuclease PolX
MSEKQKFPRDIALAVAYEIKNQLEPFCERIEIAGSLRRGKAEVGDIELLYIPRTENRQQDFFSSAPVNIAAEKISQMLAVGELAKRPSKIGVFTWGDNNKLGIHVASGVPVDLFQTTAENWWVSLVIRTGSKDTNLALTTGAQKQNARLNAYGCGVTWSDGTTTAATSERHVFELCGVEYKEPENR